MSHSTKIKHFTGYHGTPKNNIKSIQQNGYKISSDAEWFGEGIYFFGSLDSVTSGSNEAKQFLKNARKINNPAIFKSYFYTDVYIDIVKNNGHRRQFFELQDQLVKLHEKYSGSNKNVQISDKFVLSVLLKNFGTKIALIRVPCDGKKYPGYFSQIIKRFQVQIVVKDPKIIKKTILC
mgnify:CR=1 FL=1|jgi:hypothetical protein